jgi:glycerol-3-phosphate dehydrogenase (NAD(P)+)
MLWARRPELAQAIRDTHENGDYLPGAALPETLVASSDLGEAIEGRDIVVMGVPSHGFRAVLEVARPFIARDAAVVSLSKGVEQGSLLRMTEVIADVLVDHDPSRIGVLSGPNLAKEIAAGQPAATVVAFTNDGVAESVQHAFMTPNFRVYTNPDVVGCEIAGALKNVIALGVGMAHGMGFGDNAKAALITRGLAELARLGVVLGGDPLTFAGLAGMGDLIATCSSPQSRNRSVGVALGEGRSLDDIVAEMNMVAEGVKSTSAVLELARRHEVEMPVAEFVGRVLYEGAKPADHVGELMGRAAKGELEGMREA